MVVQIYCCRGTGGGIVSYKCVRVCVPALLCSARFFFFFLLDCDHEE